MYSLNYGQLSGIALDPMEKKPLYHYYPGSLVLSLGSRGCNLDCGFCQNHSSVEAHDPMATLTPEELTIFAAKAREQGSCGVAFTYTEPLMWYEFVLDSAKLLQVQNMRTILVSNGFIQQQAWLNLLPYLDAVNIDLKAFTSGFYRELGGRLQPVQRAIQLAVEHCHVEITTLLVEGHNTDRDEIQELSAFLADLDENIPLHLSRYYPAHRWKQPATNAKLIRELAELARQRLNYVYTGNLPDSWQAETRCPQCGHLLVSRADTISIDAADGQCPRCKYPVNIRVKE